MSTMNAALVTCFYEPPHYHRIGLPESNGEALLVDVLAVGLHPHVRDSAAGADAETLGDPPRVPGIDAVGRLEDGTLIYFFVGERILGTLAEKSLAEVGRWVALPEDADIVSVAAAVHPLIASGHDMSTAVEHALRGSNPVATKVVALADIEKAWMRPEAPGVCTVIVP